jgi:hypothetical protein
VWTPARQRRAAIRAAAENPVVDLSDRIQQMAQSDPSPTVCQLARHYPAAAVPGRDAMSSVVLPDPVRAAGMGDYCSVNPRLTG